MSLVEFVRIALPDLVAIALQIGQPLAICPRQCSTT